MKSLAQQHLPKSLGAFRPAHELIPLMLTQRSAMFTKLSGYPVASHVVNQVQSLLKFDSLESLLKSLISLRDNVRLAADILSTIPLANVAKQQLNRRELSEYITNNAANLGATGLISGNNTAMMEFVTYLITSSEAPLSSWILDMDDDPDKNRYVTIHKLYQSLDDSSIAPVVYSPASDSIIRLADTPRFKKMMQTANKKGADSPEVAKATALLDGQARLIKLAHVRLLDHVFMLINDVDIWDHFVSVRKSSDPSQNELRASSLRIFAGYIHSLLMYTHMWSIEMFMKTYVTMEEWITTFPSVPTHIMDQYNNIVRKYDVLNAKNDVEHIFAALQQSSDNPLGTKVRVLPSDMITAFGLDSLLEAVKKVSNATGPGISALTSLGELDKNNYTHLLLSTPVANFNMVQSIDDYLIMQGSVASEIQVAAAGTLIGLNKFYSSEVIDGIARANPSVPFAYAPPLPSIMRSKETTSASVENGSLDYVPYAPLASYKFQEFVRNNLSFKIFSARTQNLSASHGPIHIVDRDAAKHLRSLIGAEAKSLFPADVTHEVMAYTLDMLASDPQIVRQIMEAMASQPLELIKRTMTVPHTREYWATILSSFALMYVIPAETPFDQIVTAEGTLATALVTGYGKPYGIDYAALAALQGQVDAKQFIKISESVYLRILTRVPNISKTLTIDSDFYMHHHRYYFAGGTTAADCREVTHWLFDDALLNFCHLPLYKVGAPPLTFMDKRFAYVNDELYLQLDVRYNPSAHLIAAKGVSVTPQEHQWKGERHVFHITHNKWGAYAAGIQSSNLLESKSAITDLVAAAEKEMKQIDKQDARTLENMRKAPLAAIDEGQVDINLKDKAAADGKRDRKKKKGKGGPGAAKPTSDASDTLGDELPGDETKDKA